MLTISRNRFDFKFVSVFVHQQQMYSPTSPPISINRYLVVSDITRNLRGVGLG